MYTLTCFHIAIMFWVRIFICSLINAECSYRLSSYLFPIPQYFWMRARVCWRRNMRASAMWETVGQPIYLMDVKVDVLITNRDIIWSTTETFIVLRSTTSCKFTSILISNLSSVIKFIPKYYRDFTYIDCIITCYLFVRKLGRTEFLLSLLPKENIHFKVQY